MAAGAFFFSSSHAEGSSENFFDSHWHCSFIIACHSECTYTELEKDQGAWVGKNLLIFGKPIINAIKTKNRKEKREVFRIKLF